jgi:hypothetical protein
VTACRSWQATAPFLERAMAEAMTAEMILDAYWQLEGFWTKPRYPFRTPSGSWSDVDLLAYAPEKHHLVIAQSKVCGTKHPVYVYWPREPESANIIAWDNGSYLGFLQHMGTLSSRGVIFDDFETMVATITVQLVSNYYIPEEIRPRSTEVVQSQLKGVIPAKVNIDVRLETTFDIICKIIALEMKKAQGRRYGHPIIDMARELNRYMHPTLAGATKEEREVIKQALAKKLFTALRGEGWCPFSVEQPVESAIPPRTTHDRPAPPPSPASAAAIALARPPRAASAPANRSCSCTS